jgi:glycosyltransferase involved in cell wall biosynthesis
MKISLIISTYNKPQYLSCCLKSISGLNEFPDELIIADDGSGEETLKLIEKFRGETNMPVYHVWQEDNGFRLARSRNNAILRSSGDYLIFIDDDIILHPEFIKDHRRFAQKGCLYCGSRVRLNPKKTTDVMKFNNFKFTILTSGLQSRENVVRIPFLHKIIKGQGYTYKRLRGCHLAFWKEDLKRVNGFDERYTGWGYEDSDLVMRMIHAGVKRVNLKWVALCYHLYHPVKQTTSPNIEMLFEVIRDKSIRSHIGLDQH